MSQDSKCLLLSADSIFDTVREPLLVLGADLRVRKANHSFYRTFRVAPEGTVGQLIYDLGNKQWDIPWLRKLLEDVWPEASFHDFEVDHYFPTIGRKVMVLNARRIYQAGSQTELILLAIEDITERRRAEEDRRQIETHFTSLVKNIMDHAIFTMGLDGRIISWNVEAERILGYTESEIVGQPFSLIFTPEDRQDGVPGQELGAAREVGRAEDERWHVRKNGERFWALGIVTPTHDATGSHTGFSKILRDMTERKHAEMELQRAREAAETQVQERTAELRTACEGLQKEIAERLRNERAVDQSEAHKAAVLDVSIDAIITIDQEGKVAEFNPAAERTFGHSRADMIGKEMAEIILPPGLRAKHRQGLARYLATGENHVLGKRLESSAVRADGSEFPIELVIARIPGAGQPMFTGFIRDVTERKQAEAVLQERTVHAALNADVGLAFVGSSSLHEMLRLCAESMVRNLDGAFARIWTVNQRDNVLELRASAGMYTHIDGPHSRVPVGKYKIGLIAQERKPHLSNDVAHDPRISDPEWARREGMMAFAGYPLLLEDRLVGVMGLFARHRLTDMTLDAIASVANQIALGVECKIHEEILKEAQQRQQHVVASSPAVLFTLAIAAGQIHGISWISDNLLEVLGHRPAAALCPDWWLGNIHAEDRERIITQTHAELFSRGRTTHEYRFRHGDGNYRWTRGDLRLVRDGTGQPVDVVGSWSDITERKALEEQVRQAQKMEAIGRLAGGVAHDFNNLLTIINGYSELILGLLPPESPCREMARMVRRAGERGALLTQQMLTFSRRQVIAPAVLDLNVLIREAERMLRRLIGEDVELSTDLDSGLGRVVADAGQLEQVILNLAVNSRDAMPTGGSLVLRTHNADGVPGLAGGREGRYIVLSVSDTGCGMDKATQTRIFEPFFTTKEIGRGTGLGLAIVYGIVKQSGGHIDVRSEVGQGTTIEVYLPRTEVAASKRRSVTDLEIPARGSETVLLVEDEANVRALARMVLEQQGYTVLEASCGAEALAVWQRHGGPVDLLLTDVIMPKMSGAELADRLKLLQPGLRVLFVSGYTGDVLNQHRVLGEGAVFLEKPYTLTTLAGKVRDVMDRPEAAA